MCVTGRKAITSVDILTSEQQDRYVGIKTWHAHSVKAIGFFNSQEGVGGEGAEAVGSGRAGSSPLQGVGVGLTANH